MQSVEQANNGHLFFQFPLIERCVRFSLTRLSDNFHLQTLRYEAQYIVIQFKVFVKFVKDARR